MVDIDILEECRAFKWASLCFVAVKKDGQVRQTSDLCFLNKCIKCRKHPMPVLHNILHHVSSYKYFTKLDV